MHFIVAVWLVAVIIRYASDSDNVPEWTTNSTGCRTVPLEPQTPPPRLQSPAATVAAFATLSVAASAPAVAGLAAVTATLLAFTFGTDAVDTEALAEACAVALTAAAPIGAWGHTGRNAQLASGATCLAVVLVVWMSLSGHDLTVVAVAALLPAIHLSMHRLTHFPAKAPVAVLLFVAMVVSGTVHARTLGICNNDTGAAYRRDWSFAFALLYWATAVATLVSNEPTPSAAKLLLLPAAATTTMGVLGAKNGWGVIAVLTTAVLLVGLVADAAPRTTPVVNRPKAPTFMQRVVLF